MTKLEQVADAIVKAQQEVGSTSEDIARAAVEALRVPTDGMLDYRDSFVKKSDALIVWQYQIDAILNEKPE